MVVESEWPKASAEQRTAQRIAELTASRRAIADAYAVERQRIERDLHDGTQQHLVAAMIKFGEASLDAAGETLELMQAAQQDVQTGLAALRATVRGIHPQILADRGLVAALNETTLGEHLRAGRPKSPPLLRCCSIATNQECHEHRYCGLFRLAA